MPVPINDAISSFKQKQEGRGTPPKQERDETQELSWERLGPPPQRPGLQHQRPEDSRLAELEDLRDLCRLEYPQADWPNERREAARQARAGYPDRRTYDAPGVLEAPDVPDGPDVLAGYPHLRKNFPGFKVPNHYSCSAESNASAEQLSVSSGHRTPPFTDRLNSISRDRDFVSGSGTQNLANTPPPYDTGVVPRPYDTPPVAWPKHKANVTQDRTDAHLVEGEQPDVVDRDLLLAATRKIDAAAREHPGWGVVAERMDSQKHGPDKVDRNESSGYAMQDDVFRLAFAEAQLKGPYKARVSAQARKPTHYAPPENLLLLHEQVLAESFARADAALQEHGSGRTTSGPSPVVDTKNGDHWDIHYYLWLHGAYK